MEIVKFSYFRSKKSIVTFTSASFFTSALNQCIILQYISDVQGQSLSFDKSNLLENELFY